MPRQIEYRANISEKQQKLNPSRSAPPHMKTRASPKHPVNGYPWKRPSPPNSPQTPTNLTSLTILVTLRPFKQFKVK